MHASPVRADYHAVERFLGCESSITTHVFPQMRNEYKFESIVYPPWLPDSNTTARMTHSANQSSLFIIPGYDLGFLLHDFHSSQTFEKIQYRDCLHLNNFSALYAPLWDAIYWITYKTRIESVANMDAAPSLDSTPPPPEYARNGWGS